MHGSENKLMLIKTYLLLGFLLYGSERFGICQVIDGNGQKDVQQDVY
jgi:hypothetical protein